MHKILVVEDDDTLSAALEFSLTDAGYSCSVAGTFKSAGRILEEGNTINEYSLLIFDVMLPDGNGYELLKMFRDKGVKLPVIFLTAVSDEDSIVKGLDLGADDYITKPFRNAELLSRVRAVLRRADAGNIQTGNQDENASDSDRNIISYRDLRVDTTASKVFLLDEEILLSASEYKMLLYFLQNQGICLTRSLILEKIFDESGNFVDDSALYVYVNRLRDKIGDLKRKEPYIRTVRGIGYRMEKV